MKKRNFGSLMVNSKLIVFQNKTIRRIWHEDEWFFSVVDVVGVLSESSNPGAYWRKLKQRLKEEGSEVVTTCHALKLEASEYFTSISPLFF